eukprot:392072_1
MHTFIRHKGKYFRLYLFGTDTLEFEHGLHLLQDNINHLSCKCGLKLSKFKHFELIANLNRLIQHLKIQNKNNKNKSQSSVEKANKIEPFNIINNYDNNKMQ